MSEMAHSFEQGEDWREELHSKFLEDGHFTDDEEKDAYAGRIAMRYGVNYGDVTNEISLLEQRNEAWSTSYGQSLEVGSEVFQEPGAKVLDDPKKFYISGKTIQVEVRDILPFGVSVRTTDGYEFEGIIHIKNIANKFVADINRYFRFGDRVACQILEFDEEKDRLNLSTRNIVLPDYGEAGLKPTIKLMSERHGKPKPAPAPPQPEEQGPTLMAVKLAGVADKIKQEAAERQKQEVSLINRNEYDDIRAYIQETLGFEPSQEALQRYAELITRHGMFKFSMMLTKVAAVYKPDLGVLLADEIQSKFDSPAGT